MDRINNPDYKRAKSMHDFTVRNSTGELVKLDIYQGFICVVVNISTKSPDNRHYCKYFNTLIDKYGDKLRILAFPCDQFGDGAASPEEIASDAEENKVKFDIFGKLEVNGEQASDLWKYLKHAASIKTPKQGDVIKSNYTKYIVSKAGIPLERHGPEVDATKFEKLLTAHLNL